MRIKIALDHKLRTPASALPPDVRANVIEALTIPNQAKFAALKAKEWDADLLPDTIPLYSFERAQLVMPRGFLGDFLHGLVASGHSFQLDDQRTWKEIFHAGQKMLLRPWQEPARDAMIEHEQGIYKAPAGSGKTVTALAVIRKLGCKSLVIVNTKDIMWQWQQRVEDFLGPHYPVGQVGDQTFDVSPYLTVATAQTLHRRFDALEADGFFDEFSAVVLDECHHATAETYNRILNRFSARYRFGVSATPDKTGDFALATAVLGPVFHTTRPAEVIKHGALMQPTVIRVPTKFGFGFRGAESRWKRSNYPQMVEALVRNMARNELIAHAVVINEGHHQLLVSKRLEHLELLRARIESKGFVDPIVTITGQDSNEVRQQAKALAETQPCLLLSTVADEAMDIPRLDRLHLAFPARNPGLVTQQVGRVERTHPQKKDAIIYDFCDLNVGPLERQYYIRRTEVYLPRGYKISTLKPDELLAERRRSDRRTQEQTVEEDRREDERRREVQAA